MSRPFLLLQLSAPHIGADWADGEPVAGLAAAVENVRAMARHPRRPHCPDRPEHLRQARLTFSSELELVE